MPLIPYADTESLTGNPREVFATLKNKLNIFAMIANAQTCLAPTLRLGQVILSRQKLNKALREMAILAVARLEGGIYEWVQHVPMGERAGCTKEQVAALEALRFDDPVFDSRAKALLALVREVVQKVKASEAVVEAAKAQFSPQEIVEIILTCGYYMTMARLTETTRVDIDAPEGVPVPDWQRVT